MVGRVFERGAVTELSPEAERGSLGGRLLSLTRRQVIRPDAPGLDGDDAFRFRHVLIRDAAYEALTKAERADLHERFARWLERVTGAGSIEYAEIHAYHLAQAAEYLLDLGDSTAPALAGRAARALISAADAAEQVHAYGGVVRHCERALELEQRTTATGMEAAIDRVAVLRRTADASFLGGDAVTARKHGATAMGLAQAAGDVTSQCLIQAALAAYAWDDGDESTAIDHAAEAERLLAHGVPSEVRAKILASNGRFYMLQARYAEAIPMCREAIAIAAESGTASPAAASALITLATCLDQVDQPEDAERTFGEGRRMAEEATDGFNLMRYFNNFYGMIMGRGRIGEGEALLREGVEVMGRYGLDQSFGISLSLKLVGFLHWHGRPEDALQLARRAADYRLLGADAIDARLDIGIAYLDLGRLEDARTAISAARDAALRHQPADPTAPSDFLALIEVHAAMVELWLSRLLAAADGFELARRYWPTHKRVDRVRSHMLIVRVAADLAAAARERSDRVAEAAAIELAREAAIEASSEAQNAKSATDERWFWQGDLWLLHVAPELSRAEARHDPAGWKAVADMAMMYRFPHGECYARWRQAQDMITSGSPIGEVEPIIARGLEVGFACVPAQRELSALATAHGFEIEAMVEATGA